MKRSLAKLLRIVLTGVSFVFFWWGGLFISWVVLTLVRFKHRRTPALQELRCREAVSRSFLVHIGFMRMCRLMSFDPKQIERRFPRGPFVLVANHPTLIDVVLLLSTHPQMACVVNGRFFHSPFVGRLVRLCGHIDAGDGTAAEGTRVILEAVRHLRAGEPVLIFPEGTRSPARGLGRFRLGAFVMAREAKVPVVPLHIAVEPRGLMRGMAWYTVPDGTMRFSMTVLPPLHPQAYAGNARRLAADARALLGQRAVEEPESLVEPEAHAPLEFAE